MRIIKKLFKNTFVAKIFLFVGGLCMIGLGIYVIIKKINCTKKIQGTFLRNHKTTVKGSTTYSPIFSYEFHNKKYETHSLSGYSKHNVTKYKEGQQYNIFINEKIPTYFVLSRKIRFQDVICILLGILCIVLTILAD